MRTHVPREISNGFVRLDNKLGTSAAGTEVILLAYTLQNPLHACNKRCRYGPRIIWQTKYKHICREIKKEIKDFVVYYKKFLQIH